LTNGGTSTSASGSAVATPSAIKRDKAARLTGRNARTPWNTNGSSVNGNVVACSQPASTVASA
jgi:hypothetical protein